MRKEFSSFKSILFCDILEDVIPDHAVMGCVRGTHSTYARFILFVLELGISEEIDMENSLQLMQVLKELFASQSLAVLATQSAGQPYGNLVAFVAAADLKHLLFATDRSTRKFANVMGNPGVAIVVDNRSNRVEDFQKAIAVTATGKVEEVQGTAKESSLKLYLAKHPHLNTFVASPNCALLGIKVDSYYVVRNFQDVTTVHMG